MRHLRSSCSLDSSSPNERFRSPKQFILAIGMAAAVLSAVATDAADSPSPKPQRVVSLNLCVDELVLRLAERKNIASVTWLVRQRSSTVADLATGITLNHGLAEEVIPLNPDLVLAGIYTTRTAVALVKRAGIRLIDLDVPESLDAVREQIRQVGEILGEPAKAARIVADMDARLSKVPSPPRSGRPR